MRAPSRSRRRVVSLSDTSEPDTLYPRVSSTSAMPLMPMPPIPTKWTRRFGLFTAVTPCSARSGHPVHPTCPATMRCNYRSGSPSSSRLALHHLETDPRDVRGGLRTAEVARPACHRTPHLRVVEQPRERRRQAWRVELAVEDHRGSPRLGEHLGVAPLMIVGGIGIRDQDGRESHGGDLGAAHRPGA